VARKKDKWLWIWLSWKRGEPSFIFSLNVRSYFLEEHIEKGREKRKGRRKTGALYRGRRFLRRPDSRREGGHCSTRGLGGMGRG